jgi:hypothetical protein
MYIQKLFSSSIIAPIEIGGPLRNVLMVSIAIPLLLLIEWLNRKNEYGLATTFKRKIFRWLLYFIIVLMTAIMGGMQQEFVYFQF